jgi:hypothetical protein
MWASDTSNLFHVGSTGTALLGGPSGVAMAVHPGTVPQRHQWIDEIGVGVTTSTGSVVITVPRSGFSGIPFSWVQQTVTSAGSTAAMLSVTPVDTSTFHVRAVGTAASVLSDVAFMWWSRGTRVL